MNIVTTLLALLLLASTALATETTPLPDPPSGIRIYPATSDANMAPDFTLKNMDADTISLSNYRGRWVLLHFWASWCGPCRREMPEIQRLAMRFSQDKLVILMVNTAEDEDTVFSFMAEVGLDTGSLLDRDGRVTEAWKPRGLPTSFLIDPAGRVQFQVIGGREWSNPAYINFLKQLTGEN